MSRLKDPIFLIFCILVLLVSLSMVSAEHQLPSDLVDEDTGLIEGMGDWANNVTEGAFWTFMLLGFCIVLLISTVRYGMPRAFGFAGTAGLFGSMFLIIIGWMPWWIGSIFIVAGAASITFMIKSK